MFAWQDLQGLWHKENPQRGRNHLHALGALCAIVEIKSALPSDLAEMQLG